jgi:hypothetical protein
VEKNCFSGRSFSYLVKAISAVKGKELPSGIALPWFLARHVVQPCGVTPCGGAMSGVCLRSKDPRGANQLLHDNLLCVYSSCKKPQVMNKITRKLVSAHSKVGEAFAFI